MSRRPASAMAVQTEEAGHPVQSDHFNRDVDVIACAKRRSEGEEVRKDHARMGTKQYATHMCDHAQHLAAAGVSLHCVP